LVQPVGRIFIDKSGKIIKFTANLIAPVYHYRVTRLHEPRRKLRMIEVTPSATEQVAEYFKGKEVSPIRVFLNSGG
jgi:hypothetical protein